MKSLSLSLCASFLILGGHVLAAGSSRPPNVLLIISDDLNRRPGNLGRGFYTREFRYFEWPDGSQQLYHAVTDPHEYVNLAKDPRYAGILAGMKQSLGLRRAELGFDRFAQPPTQR